MMPKRVTASPFRSIDVFGPTERAGAEPPRCLILALFLSGLDFSLSVLYLGKL